MKALKEALGHGEYRECYLLTINGGICQVLDHHACRHGHRNVIVFVLNTKLVMEETAVISWSAAAYTQNSHKKRTRCLASRSMQVVFSEILSLMRMHPLDMLIKTHRALGYRSNVTLNFEHCTAIHLHIV